MYTLLSGIKQLIKWFDYLKEKEIYDNTRIIIVSDHGGSYRSGRDTAGMEGYNPLLLLKDFGERGEVEILNIFMTHADTVSLAIKNLSEEVFTEHFTKRREIAAFKAVSSQPLRHGPNLFNLVEKRELIGRELLKSESWKDWERF